MQIAVDAPYELIYLLFVRYGWRLDLAELPNVDPVPAKGTSQRPAAIDPAEAAARWHREWSRALTRFEPLDRIVREPDEETARLLRELPDDRLAQAFSTMPSAFWAEGTDRDAFNSWSESLRDDHSLPLAERPERLCLDALVPAWRTGLTTVIQLPYAGHFAERLNAATLIVSRVTRHNPSLYRQALGIPSPG
ncbi:hypothetical protein ACFXP7_09955 [Microbacterium sp. P06]|uniref:hypothetical protein n=1 Tax=unclassified Microbacterium TaxID=2609290 RepID=UPI003744C16B